MFPAKFLIILLGSQIETITCSSNDINFERISSIKKTRKSLFNPAVGTKIKVRKITPRHANKLFKHVKLNKGVELSEQDKNAYQDGRNYIYSLNRQVKLSDQLFDVNKKTSYQDFKNNYIDQDFDAISQIDEKPIELRSLSLSSTNKSTSFSSRNYRSTYLAYILIAIGIWDIFNLQIRGFVRIVKCNCIIFKKFNVGKFKYIYSREK